MSTLNGRDSSGFVRGSVEAQSALRYDSDGDVERHARRNALRRLQASRLRAERPPPDTAARDERARLEAREALEPPPWVFAEEDASAQRRYLDRQRARAGAELLGVDVPAWAVV